jgi:hypothetical protein
MRAKVLSVTVVTGFFATLWVIILINVPSYNIPLSTMNGWEIFAVVSSPFLALYGIISLANHTIKWIMGGK